jgi:hypothetical protein
MFAVCGKPLQLRTLYKVLLNWVTGLINTLLSSVKITLHKVRHRFNPDFMSIFARF